MPLNSSRLKGIFLGNRLHLMEQVWTPDRREKLHSMLDILPNPVNAEGLTSHLEWLAQTEVIFSTWGMPVLTPEQLDWMPKLKAVFYAGGTVKEFAPPLFDRNITIVSAWAANAVPVAEMTLSHILFSLKGGWKHVEQIRRTSGPGGWKGMDVRGAYGATVGIISLGVIGTKVRELLHHFNVSIVAYDPYLDQQAMYEMGIRKVELAELFTMSDVVTLHAPWLKETEGMITGELLSSMKQNSTFINTSRGALVREEEMIGVLRRRPDMMAILDVTHPEPPLHGSPLYELSNIVLTPHIAGAMGDEVLRLSDLIIEEFTAWTTGHPLRYEIAPNSLGKIA